MTEQRNWNARNSKSPKRKIIEYFVQFYVERPDNSRFDNGYDIKCQSFIRNCFIFLFEKYSKKLLTETKRRRRRIKKTTKFIKRRRLKKRCRKKWKHMLNSRLYSIHTHTHTRTCLDWPFFLVYILLYYRFCVFVPLLHS